MIIKNFDDLSTLECELSTTGYVTISTEEALELIKASPAHKLNLPKKIGAGYNYLGGGIRGGWFTPSVSDYTHHGVPKGIAEKLNNLASELMAYGQRLKKQNEDPDDEYAIIHANAISAY